MTEILIVDDELGIRNILSEILVESGYRVSTAANAAEATEQVSSRNFDLVLLDIWMPDIDGLTLLREWKYARKLNFPVIVMSGHGSIDQAKRAMEDGAIDFIEKPISLKRLLTAIQGGIAHWFAQQRALAESAQAEKRAQALKRRPTPRPTGRLPVFEIPRYGITLDYNRPFRDVLFELERSYFRTVLTHMGHSMAELARHAGMERTHLYRKIRTLGLNVDGMRKEAQRTQAEPPSELSTSVTTTPPAQPSNDKIIIVDPIESEDPNDLLEEPTGSTLDSKVISLK